MADFNASSSSVEKPTFSTMMPMLCGAFDDPSEDACSICLEPFNCEDPASVTSCKHEYHLHCILEWFKRSNECPICSQLLVMKDPASQELLVAMKSERCSRSRNQIATSTTLSFHEDDTEQNTSYLNDSNFHERIMQHLPAAASRAHYVCRSQRQRSSGQELVISSFEEMPQQTSIASLLRPDLVFDSSDRCSLPSSSLSEVHLQSPSSVVPTNANSIFNPCTGSELTMKPRVHHWQAPSDNKQRTSTSEMFSFPESIKSKFSATSARYKESFSRRTQGIKEKLLDRNSSLKELSKGVQREMNAGIAGVARMIERLDLVSRRNAASNSDQGFTAGTSNIFKGLHVQENVIVEASVTENGHNLHSSNSNVTSYDSGTRTGSLEGSHGVARKDINYGHFD